MCGRFTLASDPESFLKRFSLEIPEGLEHPRLFNIAPSQPVLGLVANPAIALEVMEWGFIPSWAKEEKSFKPVINARAETVAEKPYFRGSFRSSRCAILADGFYEWKKVGDTKHPHHIGLKDGGVFAMAGLWSHRVVADGSEQVTCAIITTGPNALMKDLHDRMPAILNEEGVEAWLDREARSTELEALLRPYPAEEMRAYEVSTLVNNPRNDSEECMKPWSEED